MNKKEAKLLLALRGLKKAFTNDERPIAQEFVIDERGSVMTYLDDFCKYVAKELIKKQK